MHHVGPYRLDALVGRGTNGTVWRATRLGPVAHEVALKRAVVASGSSTAGAVDRLRREAAILAELDHPHIVRVIDVLEDDRGPVIVMSLARGGSLHDLLEERGRLTPGQTVAVLARVADAVGSAHRRGVLHGDVKPANILFTTDGEPLLGDFGVAQHLVPDSGGDITRHAVEGTTGYVDPELVATGRHEPRNDVYGLGVVAYLCLTGRLPHTGSTGRDVLAAADAGDHPPLSGATEVPATLAAVVEAAMARDPARRPATAEELADGLRGAVQGERVRLPGTALRAGVELDPSALAADDPSEGRTPAPAPGDGPVGRDGRADRPRHHGGDDPDGGRAGDGRYEGAVRGGGALRHARDGGDGRDIWDLWDDDHGPGSGSTSADPGGSGRPRSAAGPDGPGGSASGASDPATGDASHRDPGGGRDDAAGVDRGTRVFGPRPPAPDGADDRDGSLVRLLAVVGVLGLAVGGGLVLRDRLSQEQAPTDVSVAGGGAPDATACVTPGPLPVPEGSIEIDGDLDGDGCPEQVVWDGQVMRFRSGADEEVRLYDFRSVDGDRSPGQLLLGDWDCDGIDSPALYRPTSGVVLYFPVVPERVGAEVTADPDPTRVRDGEATVEPGDGDDCDSVEVTPTA